MSEELQTEVTETQEPDYVAALTELKANSVNKAQYEKLKEENARLIKAMMEGKEIPVEEVQKPSVKELANELMGGDGFKGSDLDFWKKSLALRNQMIEEGYQDPYLPNGREAQLTAQDYETADRVASIVDECIKAADGNNGVFIAELQRRMTGTAIDRMKI